MQGSTATETIAQAQLLERTAITSTGSYVARIAPWLTMRRDAASRLCASTDFNSVAEQREHYKGIIEKCDREIMGLLDIPADVYFRGTNHL